MQLPIKSNEITYFFLCSTNVPYHRAHDELQSYLGISLQISFSMCMNCIADSIAASRQYAGAKVNDEFTILINLFRVHNVALEQKNECMVVRVHSLQKIALHSGENEIHLNQ